MQALWIILGLALVSVLAQNQSVPDVKEKDPFDGNDCLPKFPCSSSSSTWQGAYQSAKQEVASAESKFYSGSLSLKDLLQAYDKMNFASVRYYQAKCKERGQGDCINQSTLSNIQTISYGDDSQNFDSSEEVGSMDMGGESNTDYQNFDGMDSQNFDSQQDQDFWV